MKKSYFLLIILLLPLLSFSPNKDVLLLLKDATIIDGNGGKPLLHTDILIKNDQIIDIGPNIKAVDARVINCNGKTIMPAIISAHVHLGMIGPKPAYTRENILNQLKKYTDYGITNVLVMGTDEPMLFESGLRDSSINGQLPGARIFTAGYGFSIPNGPPSGKFLYRPTSQEHAIKAVDSLATLHPDAIKIWVDNFGGGIPKMDSSIYSAIIKRAHDHNIRVAAHLYYVADAERLLNDGLDIMAHSIRDQVVNDVTAQQIKHHNIIYIPTLALDKYAVAYTNLPPWINDPFFLHSLEPGVYDFLVNNLQEQVNPRNQRAFETALKNVKKLHDAGVIIALGTDSGANNVRTQGFSEHLEMELLVLAGLTPMEAITAATKNAAMAIGIQKKYGTLEKGKIADLLILNDNPSNNIINTRKISEVYKAGKLVSHGPL
ncbi:amidohydrolase [Chitinophaga silvatica]|uniref:Amidohydrolase n=1 Tax=Chitinophaga silvatica TaxID=2282649 RepID=A0A3E1YGR5_9BACT|nr:amidohydrolase family protein [Chitinophaga silvatica]RFS26554.1 amidohydrolase [Chitinophaga silvatica]